MEEQEKTGVGLKIAFAVIIVLIVLLSAAVGLVFFGDSVGIDVKSWFAQETTAPPTEPVMTVQATTAAPTTAPATYYVPYVVGMNAKDAYYELNEAGVHFTVKREYSTTVKAEVVLGQEPEEGIVTDSDTVTVIISKGVDQPDTTPPATTKPSKKQETTSATGASGATGGTYLLKDSDSRYIGRSEVAGMSEQQLTLALNEIYARRGRKFNSRELQAYFDSQPWYKGTIAPSAFDENSLNKFEKANVQTILKVMREKGYR